jgi:hypothetical protein
MLMQFMILLSVKVDLGILIFFTLSSIQLSDENNLELPASWLLILDFLGTLLQLDQ